MELNNKSLFLPMESLTQRSLVEWMSFKQWPKLSLLPPMALPYPWDFTVLQWILDIWPVYHISWRTVIARIARMAEKCRLALCLGPKGKLFGEQLESATFHPFWHKMSVFYLLNTYSRHPFPRDVSIRNDKEIGTSPEFIKEEMMNTGKHMLKFFL